VVIPSVCLRPLTQVILRWLQLIVWWWRQR
jgi:hypothetical protein